MLSGKVFLVGAGPGDGGLLTLKGRDLLRRAEVVVYDALVGDGVLSMIPPGAKKIDVGKRSGRHKMTQEEINRLLLEEAERGALVVRLKGGDPFLFGRGGEELELLAERGIPYEVVPGVSSPIAVPAYNGIPVTHRDFASSLHIITGHKREGKEAELPFEALAQLGGTLIFLMGTASLRGICEGLTEAGMDRDTPAALLSRGTTARQSRIVATLSTLADEVERRHPETPAIIAVGEVCALADSFAWYEALPLSGRKIVLTRPRELVSGMARLLRERGAEVLELPSIRTERIPDNQRLRRALRRLPEYDWLILTSPTGARVFFEELRDCGADVRALAGVKIAALGEGTKRALAERGLQADLMPEIYDGRSLGEAVAREAPPGSRILMPRAKLGSREILEALSGFELDDIPSYETLWEEQTQLPLKRLFEAGEIDLAAFTSSSSVRGFARANPGLDFSAVRAACIGRQTEATAAGYGMRTERAEKATVESLVALIEKMLGKREDSRQA